MCCERWSNEAATVHADITADHRDVPALGFHVNFLQWDVANPRTTMPFPNNFFYMVLHGRHNLVLDDYFFCRFWSLVWTTLDIFGRPLLYSWSTTTGSTLGLMSNCLGWLHVTGLSSWWISSKIQFCLACVSGDTICLFHGIKGVNRCHGVLLFYIVLRRNMPICQHDDPQANYVNIEVDWRASMFCEGRFGFCGFIPPSNCWTVGKTVG